ncbi:MAG: UDP-N-acetylglucosamine 1-carboxyvinyltransferase [Bradyrhizobium sp.]|uniref:UDP-N-acetylglucosamine 1-carboxyvinyltransferase n=1 Tax=Bradyrhizobium sp. TaxID=376 RepID=UPI0011F5E5FF|nr:UDP-N-acetylglucosamine 1-carboxyvinyltransferase [Bradyrhizobium sp.]THD65554.1 MAG: UDP-N-acetylglucosamine 1-carboxyvinyltransferase [Bradyrhizobium sp.]
MAPIQYIVEGGHRLTGTIEPSGNKNAALPIIAAALLTEHPVTLENVPRIRDTETLVELIRSVGATVEWRRRNTLFIHAKDIRAADLDPGLCARIRASILLAGPLLARCGGLMLPPPGGDVIGRRRLDTHFLAFEQLGATVVATDRLEFRATRLKGADVFLDEPSVTATENALMAAVAAHGTTYLRNVASEPHVQDLAHFLVALGARIEGIGTNTMVVHGPATLGACTYSIGPDHIEVGSLIGLAAVTRSPLRIARAGVEHLRSIRMGFERLGIVCEVDGDDLTVSGEQTLKVQDDFGGHVPKLEDQPWPAFPADLMSIAIVTATQCDGVILMFEKMFESRMFFVDKLISMGARIVLCDPHRAIVAGPSRLRGALMSSPDIRAGMAMLLAALCAKGVSTINNADQIERGYERIDERLNALGARITRVPERAHDT